MKRILIVVLVAALVLFMMSAAVAGEGKGKRENESDEFENGADGSDDESDDDSDDSAPGKNKKNKSAVSASECMQDAEPGEKKQCIIQLREMVRNKTISHMESICENHMQGERATRCMARVQALGECWEMEPGLKRAACARQKLELGNTTRVRERVRECNDAEDKQSCINETKAQVYSYISVKIQSLIERAEGLVAQGADEETVADVIEDLGELADEFSDADTIEQKKQAIARIRNEWREFMGEVLGQISDEDGS